VVIARDDMRPVEFAHPALIKPGPIRAHVAAAAPASDAAADPMSPRMRLGADTGADVPRTWRGVAVAKRAEAEKAAEKAEEARRAAVRANADSARFAKPLRIAEGAKRRAETQLENAERELEAGASPRAEQAKATALVRLEEAKAHFEALQAEAQPKLDQLAAAREAVRTLEAARASAVTEAKIAESRAAPVSVFISRQTQRLYVRQGFKPKFETEVTISDPETPIGTTIFTAVGYVDGGADVRWMALAMYPKGGSAEPTPAAGKQRRATHQVAEAAVTDADAAKAALERVSIPPEAVERIAEFVSPGSALIISDEPLHRETSTGTDFIVIMSGEPQGGIKIRRRNPYPGAERYYRRSPYGGNPFSWW
jgi:hypothetical protein